MRRLIILAFIFVTMISLAQENIAFSSVDSITYQSYLSGDWETLIRIGKDAIKQGIDYKYLRQRMGYAYFIKANYYAARLQYEKALKFDESDSDTRLYLYYCALNIGDDSNARFRASKLKSDIQKSEGLKPFKILNAADVEYNYKANDAGLSIRSNPNYYRIGLNTQLAYRLNFYQAISQYFQTINTTSTVQTEYYSLLNWTLGPHSSLDAGYHRVITKAGTTIYDGNMFFAKYSKRINRFNLGVNGSILTNATSNVIQLGILGGVILPGKANIYLNSSLQSLTDSVETRIIYSQSIGAKIFKPIWIEGNITLGNIKNYNDHDGLYLYNSIDATTFRSGISIFYLLNKNIKFIVNYTYDLKEITNPFSSINSNYNQYSFSGGIIWKI